MQWIISLNKHIWDYCLKKHGWPIFWAQEWHADIVGVGSCMFIHINTETFHLFISYISTTIFKFYTVHSDIWLLETARVFHSHKQSEISEELNVFPPPHIFITEPHTQAVSVSKLAWHQPLQLSVVSDRDLLARYLTDAEPKWIF